jgi:polyhydroxyalkanoate synthesis regulator phasin
MFSTLKKIGLFGIGVTALTQEKIEEFMQEMVKKGEMNREEGKLFVANILLEKDRQIKDIEEKISKKIKDTIDESGVATKKDIKSIEERIESLEKDIKTT